MGAVAEEEEEDSWGLSSEDEEDNSVWTECDNFIVRNSVSTHHVRSDGGGGETDKPDPARSRQPAPLNM